MLGITCVAANSSELGSETWQQFADAVSGEWEGVTGTFDAHGQPQQLPEYYVPQAFREWGVELYDWQSQCSMLASDSGLQYTLRRMMPSVGCEADATAFTEEAQHSLKTATEQTGEAKTIMPNGSYSIGPRRLEGTARIESCLFTAEKQRIRMIHLLKQRPQSQDWALDSLELHHERWDSPHTGRQELAGCGGGMPAFANKARVTAEQVSGAWKVEEHRAYSLTADGAFEVSAASIGEVRQHDNSEGRLLLPLGACSIVRGSGGDLRVVAGVVSDAGKMHVAARAYKAGQLQRVELTVESRSA
ncbi:hypothetical protein WJX72_003936 [[Myrmecia] bisecta]|uniref:Uncharacterized protein n=1 Tax=[Myrmecia] bisecta TaxID=41462 RepID=A0AAW1QQ47_9CHLO